MRYVHLCTVGWHAKLCDPMWQVKVEGKGRYCNIWLLRSEPLTELRSVICHMGSHSVICHPTGERAP